MQDQTPSRGDPRTYAILGAAHAVRILGSEFLESVYREALVVECRAEAAQVLNYLAVTGHEVALLINFGAPRLDYRRFILTNRKMPALD